MPKLARRSTRSSISPRALASLSPRFVALANELVDGFAPTGECEYVAQFAEPYAARVIAILLGLPEEEDPVEEDPTRPGGLWDLEGEVEGGVAYGGDDPGEGAEEPEG